MLLIQNHISGLQARISAYELEGDPGPILDGAALSEADALMAAQTGDLQDLPILRTVGMLYWHRAGLAAGDERTHHLRTALPMLNPVAGHAPESLPADVVEYLDSPTGQYLYLAHLASTLVPRYNETGDPRILDTAIDAGLEALGLGAEHESDLLPLLWDVGSALMLRFVSTGSESDAEQAIEVFHLAVSRATTEDQRYSILGSLASTQQGLYQQRGDLEDLTAAIDAFTSVRTAGRMTSADRPELGRALVQRFEASGDLADLDDAIAVLGEGIRTAGADEYLWGECVRWLNVAYIARFDETNAQEDLQRGLRVLRKDPDENHVEPQPGNLLFQLAFGLLENLDEQISRPLFDRIAILFRAAVRTDPGLDGSLEMLATIFYQRYTYSGHPGHLERATRALDAAALPDSWADPLLRSTLQRSSQRDAEGGVEEWAARSARFLCAVMPSSWHYRGLAVASLSDFLRDCYLITGRLDELDEAIAAAREWPAGEDPQSASVAQLASLLGMRGDHTRDRRYLDEAIAALKAAPDTDPVRSALGGLLLQLVKFGPAPDEVRDALTILRRMVAETPEDNGNRPARMANLAAALAADFDDSQDITSLDEAISLHRSALASTMDGTSRYLRRLAGLGSALRKRGVADEDETSLNEAVSSLSRVLDEGSAPVRVEAFDSLVSALDAVRRRTRDPLVLDEMIRRLDTACADPAFDLQQRFKAAGRLGWALHRRYERDGVEADLDAAVDILRQASDSEAAERAGALDDLGAVLRIRCERNGSKADADAAVEAHREALQMTAERAPEYAARLAAAGLSLCSRFEVAGEREDVDAALALLRRAVQETAEDDDDRTATESDLGVVLMRRFAVTQDQAELDESIELQRRALADAGDEHTDRTRRLLNLSGPLRLRFERYGRLADLDEAIAAMRTVSADDTYRAGERPELFADLGICLWTRSQRTDDEADLHEAIDHLRTALDLLPEGHAIRPKALSGLATAHLLLARREDPVDREQLTTAIGLSRAAVAAANPDHYQSLVWQGNLAAKLHDRHKLTGDEEDRTEAITILETMLGATNAGADQGGWLVNLGHFLSSGAQDSDAEYSRALAAYRRAAESETVPADLRCEAARWWGITAGRRGDWEVAVAGFSRAVDLLPLAVARGLHRSDQQFKLGTFAGLGPDAAACAIRAGDPRLALQLLEQGRGVLLAQALETRDEIAELSSRHPEHAERFVALRARLDAPAGNKGPDNDLLHRLAAECDTLVDEIRGLPGWSRFLRPPATDEILRTVPAGSAAVVLNASRFGFDAVIVSSGELTIVPLTSVAEDELRLHSAELAAAIGIFHDQQADYDFRVFAVEKAFDCLAWLWRTVAEPVLGHLGLTAAGTTLPRLWWIPTGAFTHLPLHAAGLHEDPDPCANTVLDRVISSYAPTLRSIVRVQGRSIAPDEPGAIVVAATDVPGHRRLTAGEAEVAVAAAYLPRAEVLTSATPEAVLATLDTVTYAHFACHAAADLEDPSSSHLVLHGGRLSITDIAAKRSPNAFLAYLSACETSRTSTALADESIHIASAFQLAGFQHVIATLWPLSDSTARDVAEHVYARLSSGPAQALHEAIHRQRDHDPGDIINWIAPIHTGAE